MRASFPALHAIGKSLAGLVLWGLCAVLLGGCSAWKARQQLQHVAKDWCETIRASQVICVYPLTEDLQPGDVFLVQVPLQQEADLYKRSGFLALDDHQVRLKNVGYKEMYFDSYWKDAFGEIPHPRPALQGAGPIDKADEPPAKRAEATAPRAAFPTYSFEARSQLGAGLALPVKGVPVGLNFLSADRATGTVTIADARTYAGDTVELYQALSVWAESTPKIQQLLRDTVRQSRRDYLILRVVTRVYLTGTVVVSLTRADTSGADVSVGNAPKLSLVDANGSVDENVKNTLDALSKRADPVTALANAGGAVTFISSSNRSVTLSESFDRLLVIGYLGFDVPVYPGGVLGAPIPTFQRLEGIAPTPPPTAGELSLEQSRFKLEEAGLEALASKDPKAALKVMTGVTTRLKAKEFAETEQLLKAASKAVGTPDEGVAVGKALASFEKAAVQYVRVGGQHGPRYERFSDALADAYDHRDE